MTETFFVLHVAVIVGAYLDVAPKRFVPRPHHQVDIVVGNRVDEGGNGIFHHEVFLNAEKEGRPGGC